MPEDTMQWLPSRPGVVIKSGIPFLGKWDLLGMVLVLPGLCHRSPVTLSLSLISPGNKSDPLFYVSRIPPCNSVGI